MESPRTLSRILAVSVFLFSVPLGFCGPAVSLVKALNVTRDSVYTAASEASHGKSASLSSNSQRGRSGSWSSVFARRLPPSATACAPASSYYAPAESLRGRSPDSSESAFPERIGGRSASISKELGAGATRVPYRTRSCNASSSWQTTLCLAASAGARAAWSPKSASPPTPSHASGAAKVREPNLSREFKDFSPPAI